VVFVNLAVAGSFITVLVLWDLFGQLPLPLGVAGHEGSTLLVALNGMRLLTNRAWRAAGRSGKPASPTSSVPGCPDRGFAGLPRNAPGPGTKTPSPSLAQT
jgi:cation-transporting P-type ATPase D